MEIQEIKQHLGMAAVLSRYGLKPDKHQHLHCPFHEDTTPSMKIYYKTNTVYCFSANCPTHGKSMDVIDFIMHREKCTKHDAILKAQEMAGLASPAIAGPMLRAMPEQSALTPGQRAALLQKMFTYFKNAVYNSKPAQEYIQSRKLDFTKLEIGYNSGQFHHGTRKDGHLIRECLVAGLLRQCGTAASTGEPAYSVFGKYCIAFALRGKENQVEGLYFRSILGEKESRHFYLKDRAGLYPAYPPPETKRLILTEAIIDAATLLQIPHITSEYDILSCYGTNGLTGEHRKAIRELEELQEIILFYDGDPPGREAIRQHADTLRQINSGITLSYIKTPEGEDINSLSQGHDPGIFTHLLSDRCPVPIPSQDTETTPLSTTEEKNQEPRARSQEDQHTDTSFLSSTEKKNQEPRTKSQDDQPIVPSAHRTVSPPAHRPMGTLDTSNPYNLYYQGLTARYYIKGGIRPQMDSMRVSLQAMHPETDEDYRTKLDLYEFKQVNATATAAAEKLSLRADLVEKDLCRMTTLLESYREQNQEPKARNQDKEDRIKVPESTARECIAFLQTPGLITRINALIEQSGVTGEEMNRILLFVIASSYKMPDTLHALVQGSSGSGKTHLILKIAGLMPPEHCITLTRVTDSSFYNYGENELSHKLLCMEDLDGLKEEAFLAFRELQSRGQLTSSTSIKDDNGNSRGAFKLVNGPIASLSATTQGEVYEDNMSRSFLVAVDESREQSQRIIKYQNEKAAGLTDSAKEAEIKMFLQHCIRLLKPYTVVNPYAGRVHLPQEAHKIRRLNDLYQSFVRQVTLINQYQRKKDTQNRLIAEKEDLQTASEILFESIILKVDELDGSLRQFYEQLKAYICQQGGDYHNYQFTGREIRQEHKISKTQMFRYLGDLQELEYIAQTGGYANRGFKYKITYWDDLGALRQRIHSHLQEQINNL